MDAAYLVGGTVQFCGDEFNGLTCDGDGLNLQALHALTYGSPGTSSGVLVQVQHSSVTLNTGIGLEKYRRYESERSYALPRVMQ